MGRVSTQTFSPSDSQSDLVSKLNYNFNELVGSYGGTLADKGPTGERGAIGLRGPAGSTGYQGKRGSRWFAGPSGPTGPDINYGDYWIDLGGDCYKFSSSGWEFVTPLRVDSALFRLVDAGTGPGGVTGGVVLTMDQDNPEKYSFVFADDNPVSLSNLNPEGAKFVISSNPDISGSYLLEFSRGDLDTPGSTGSTSDSVRHPSFSWYGDSSQANLNFDVPGSFLYINYGGGSGAFRTMAVIDSGESDIIMGNSSDQVSGSYFISSDMQNWIVSGNISFETIGDSSSYEITSDNSFTINSSSNIAHFGSINTNNYTINLTPLASNTSGYVRIYRNTNSNTANEYSVPFLSKIYLNSSVLTNYGTQSSFLCRIRSTSQSGSAGELNCLYVTENGKIYTEKTSERYYNLTTAEFTLG
jgi:hypothetical protein